MLYWTAQALFAVAFVVAATSGAISTTILAASAAVQLGLVSWRLWMARAKPWLALVPPTTTVALWYGLGFWAAKERGSDGAGLLTMMVTAGWCVIAYATIAVWAGFQRTGPMPS